MKTERTLQRCIAWILVAGMAVPAPSQQLDAHRMDVIRNAMSGRIMVQTVVWFETGDFPKSIQAMRGDHAIRPADYEVATNLGWMLENTLAWDEALATYVRFRKSNPDNPDAAYPEANFYFMKKTYLEIPPLLEPSLHFAQAPHPNSFRVLAHAYDRLGLLSDSKRVWEMLLKLDPPDRAAKVNLSRVERKIKDGASKPAIPNSPAKPGG